ncbi:LytR/AlgR family response regulator transcription factor [Cupriavidus sp. M-11]|uniref:LytR/AlgR family response regulator transcription factor n=1 Tax=Cupriavidus sp. M-11 TaxID=3233038 RepID=UPI003F92D02F
MQATALIAEDEILLAADLRAELSRLWPDLRILATVGDGAAAVTQALALQPDLLFLDIRMPGMSGLEAAQVLAEDWPAGGKPFPLVVFVTAFDNYALHAFEQAAADYILKPVQPERLAKACTRLQAALAQRAQSPASDATLAQLRTLLGAGSPLAPASGSSQPLKVIQASAGSTITMVPVAEVLYFEADDKYVRVVTAGGGQHWIRLSLRELQARLDPQVFWQVHRGTIVRADAIATATRDDAGKITLTLRGSDDKVGVSRLYADLFKGM